MSLRVAPCRAKMTFGDIGVSMFDFSTRITSLHLPSVRHFNRFVIRRRLKPFTIAVSIVARAARFSQSNPILELQMLENLHLAVFIT
jgi:hypothetical protein